MKSNIDDFIHKSFKALNEISLPTIEQKEALMNKVLLEAKTQDISKISDFKNIIFEYPWRFAFGASTLQAIAFSIVFGSSYSNLIFQVIGR